MNRLTTGLSGAASSVLIVIGTLLLVGKEVESLTDAEIRNHFADRSNRLTEIAGLVMLVVGAALFLWFVAHLRARLATTDTGRSGIASLLFGAASTATALLVVAGTLLGATAAAVQYSNQFHVVPDLARLTVIVGYLLLFGSVTINCLTVAVTSVLVLRDNTVPDWLAWVGFVAIPLALVEGVLLPVFVIPAWVLITALTLAIRRPAPAVTTSVAAAA
jgi:hypothetical protein